MLNPIPHQGRVNAGGAWTQPVKRTSGIDNAAASSRTQILDMEGPRPDEL
jgi:hypothetical protein